MVPCELHSAAPDCTESNNELARLIEYWSSLPEAMRVGIMAMIDASVGDDSDR